MRLAKWLISTMLAISVFTCCAAPLARPIITTFQDDVPTGPWVSKDFPVPDVVDFKADPVFWVDYEIALQPVVEQIAMMDMAIVAGADHITIVIDSEGGDIQSGFALGQAFLRYHQAGVPVNCVVKGKAFSMAFYLLQACSVRAATIDSTLMAHEPSVGARMTRQQMREYAEGLDKLTDQLGTVGSLRMNISKNEFLRRIDGKNWYITPEEALELGAIDRIILPTDAPGQHVARTMEEWVKEMQGWLLRNGYEIDQLLTEPPVQPGPKAP